MITTELARMLLNQASVKPRATDLTVYLRDVGRPAQPA